MAKKNGKAQIVTEELSPDMMPTQAVEVDGQRPGVGIPGSEDVFAGFMRGGANMVREMLTGSGKPEEYLPRTRIAEPEIGMYARILAMLQGFDGIVDVPSIIAFKCNARIGLNGEGRGEAVQMIVAENKRLSHVMSRLQGNRGMQKENLG